MRSREPIEVAVPLARRLVGVLVGLIGGALLAAVIPFDSHVLGITLILIALGFMV